MHVRRALALTLTVPLLLTGCSDDPEPEPKMPDPTPTSSAPSPTESETPEAESPEEFIRRWVEAGDRMQVTGETEEYNELVGSTCKACSTFAGSVSEIYDAGGTIEFDGSTINRIVAREKQPPTFALTKTLPKTVIRRTTGADAEVLPAGRTTLLVILKNRAGEWSVTYYGVL